MLESAKTSSKGTQIPEFHIGDKFMSTCDITCVLICDLLFLRDLSYMGLLLLFCQQCQERRWLDLGVFAGLCYGTPGWKQDFVQQHLSRWYGSGCSPTCEGGTANREGIYGTRTEGQLVFYGSAETNSLNFQVRDVNFPHQRFFP